MDLLPSEEDCSLVRAYKGSLDALGVVERFTRACDLVPFCRERASAMLARAAFTERAPAFASAVTALSILPSSRR